MTEVTNLEKKHGSLADALKGADIFVGVSAPNIVTEEMVASMNKDSILLPWLTLFLKSCLTKLRLPVLKSSEQAEVIS